MEVREDLMTPAQVAEWDAYLEADEDYSYACQAYSEMLAEGFAGFYQDCMDPTMTNGDVARNFGLVEPVAPTPPAATPAWDGAPYPAKDPARLQGEDYPF